MDLEKGYMLASMCAVLCKTRDLYRSRRRPCRAIPYCVPAQMHLCRSRFLLYMDSLALNLLSCTLLL